MTERIRNYQAMIKSATSIKTVIAVILVFSCLFSSICLEASLIVDATKAEGAWEEGVVTSREVILTSKSNVVSEIEIDVPYSGKYQLIAYVHHNWRKVIPCIYVKAVDSEGNIHKGYHKIENIWYLKEDEASPGRWFFICLTEGNYWRLPSGKLNIRFWAEGNSSPWEDTAVPMEGKVSINTFVLIPLVTHKSNLYLPWIINPEAGKGEWNTFNYYPGYATNLIKANKKKSLFSCRMNVPVSGYYQGWLSALSPLSSRLEVVIKNRLEKQSINIDLPTGDTWKLISTKPLYLNRDTYSIFFKNVSSNQTMVDFFLLLPVSESTN